MRRGRRTRFARSARLGARSRWFSPRRIFLEARSCRPVDVTGERKTLTFPHYDSFPTLRLRNDALCRPRTGGQPRETESRGRSLNSRPAAE